MANKQLHIVIADSSQLIQLGLKKALEKMDRVIHLYFVEQINALQSLLQEKEIDVVILNPQLILNQEKAFHQLKNDTVGVKWVAFLQTLYEDTLLAQFDARITLYDSIEGIQSLLLTTIADERQNEEMNRQPLSEREIEVLHLLVLGLSNKEIADKLFISTYTVISHRKNITQKTGIKSVSGLTIYAVVKGIISLNSVP